MYSQSIMLAVGLATSLAASQPTVERRLALPTIDLADGAYFADFNTDGTTNYTLIHPSDLSVRAASAEPMVLARKNSGAHCSNHGVNAGDVNNAQNALRDLCGNGYFFGSRAIVQVRGSALAFGCNYGNGQTCHASDVSKFYSELDQKCGKAQAGWYSIEDWKASYGRDTNPSGYC